MQAHVLIASLSFCILTLGIFLGAGVRPLLLSLMKSEPALIAPILTGIFSRYNILALGLSTVCLALEIASTHSLAGTFVMTALTLILALKLPFDRIVKRREGSGQIRGVGVEGKQLDFLHRIVEAATLAILALALVSFVLNLMPAGAI